MCFNTEEAQWCFQPSRHGELQTHLRARSAFLSSLHCLSAECMSDSVCGGQQSKSPLCARQISFNLAHQAIWGPLVLWTEVLVNSATWGHHWANGQNLSFMISRWSILFSLVYWFFREWRFDGEEPCHIHCLIKMYWRSVHVRAWAQCQSVWVISDAVESRHLEWLSMNDSVLSSADLLPPGTNLKGVIQ